MPEEATVIPDVCSRHCGVCEGMDHHWMYDADDENPEGVMVCKHCPAVREVADDEGDEDF